MSVTVVAIPAALTWAINALIVTSAVAIKAGEIIAENEQTRNVEEFCNDFHIISEANFMEKSLETPFMDKNILLKTLEEHGVKNIKEDFNKIQGEYDSYSFSFEKRGRSTLLCSKTVVITCPFLSEPSIARFRASVQDAVKIILS